MYAYEIPGHDPMIPGWEIVIVWSQPGVPQWKRNMRIFDTVEMCQRMSEPQVRILTNLAIINSVWWVTVKEWHHCVKLLGDSDSAEDVGLLDLEGLFDLDCFYCRSERLRLDVEDIPETWHVPQTKSILKGHLTSSIIFTVSELLYSFFPGKEPQYIWVFPKIGIPQNGWLKIMEHHIF